ncbi:trichohyalin-like [Elysia marginata]|uniref:Trichohyalin-like n=1 Tax=Elysia marginata TaxID=1093978 RepID=A0AAV4I3Q7_9GAST|nr:trichohyalin-like [Elysia marginata]
MEDVFRDLDPRGQGFVPYKEIQRFYSAQVGSPINEELIKTVVSSICGDGSLNVPEHDFISVLEELERRYTIESEAYWDFQALDCYGNNYINLSHALLLFREYHGDLFSLDIWRSFLESRETPESDVYFDELPMWLSAPIGNSCPSSQKEIVQEEFRLERIQAEAACRQLKETDSLVDTMDLKREEKERRQEHTEHEVKRKLQKWLTHGLAAMLKDDTGPDGDTAEEPLNLSNKESIKTTDVLSLLETKYSLLQDRVLMELSAHVASIESEKAEIFKKLKKMTSKPQSKKFEDEELSQLVEKTSLPFTFLGMLGDLSDKDCGRRQEFEALRVQLLEQGKSEVEVDSHLRIVYNQTMKSKWRLKRIM